ncbi:MAG: hypothetical protein OHK0039_01550 [Bacteroidia bacterium]
MKYIEYLYLTLAIMCLIFLLVEYEQLMTSNMVALLVAMAIFSFMFTFRRRQRKQMEAMYEAEIRRLQEEEDAADDET